jgi:hypothetical protein
LNARCDFGEWDRVSALLRDVKTCETIRLGVGNGGTVNDASSHAVWIERPPSDVVGTAWLMDLESRQRSELGPATWVAFDAASGRVVTGLSASDRALNGAFDLQGQSVAIPSTPAPIWTPTPAPPTQESPTPGDYRLFHSETNRWVVTNADLDPLFELDAEIVRPLEDSLLVLTRSIYTTPEAVSTATRNLYLVSVPDGEVTFVSTISGDSRAEADARYVVWSEGFCWFRERGTTHILDRTTGAVGVISQPLFKYFRDDGMFSAAGWSMVGEDLRISLHVLDVPELLLTTVTTGSGFIGWSPDWRYASPYVPQKGGYCI